MVIDIADGRRGRVDAGDRRPPSRWFRACFGGVSRLRSESCPSLALCIVTGGLDGNVFVSSNPAGGADAWAATHVEPTDHPNTAFAERMTKRAREIGLAKSTFGNSNGLPDPRQLMTARELAKLARHLILTYPEYYKIYSEREFTWNKIRQFNRNPLLAMNIGADGLKTGFTKEAGYGLVGSAVQNGTGFHPCRLNRRVWSAKCGDVGSVDCE